MVERFTVNRNQLFLIIGHFVGALIMSNLLTHQEHAIVSLHLLEHRLTKRLSVTKLPHVSPSGASTVLIMTSSRAGADSSAKRTAAIPSC